MRTALTTPANAPSPKLPSMITHILIQMFNKLEEIDNVYQWAWMLHDLKWIMEKGSRVFLVAT